jgi:hypothetical protein
MPSSRVTWWGLAPPTGESLVLALVFGVSVYAALRLLERYPRHGWLACVALVQVFYGLGPITYLGDWTWIIKIADGLDVVPKWYGASLIYGLFHHTVGRFLGFPAQESVRLLSAVCGAGTVYVWWRVARRLGATRAAWWPMLFLSTFGVVGLGLAHVEVYPLVVLTLSLHLWSSVAAVEDRSTRSGLVLGLLSGVALVLYIGLVLQVVIFAGILWWLARQGRRKLALASAGAFLLPPVLAAIVGPSPRWYEAWAFFRGEPGTLPLLVPPIPADADWRFLHGFLSANYWFAGWHLGDILNHLLLDALGPLFLLAALFRRCRLTPALLVLGGSAALYGLYGFFVLPGMGYPRDWDLVAYAACPVLFLTTALLGSPPTGSRRPERLLPVLAVLSLILGLSFFVGLGRPPAVFGPAAGGLSLAAEPDEFVLTERGMYIRFWIRNETDQDRTLPASFGSSYALCGPDVTPTIERRTVMGYRVIKPGQAVVILNFPYLPKEVPQRDATMTWRMELALGSVLVSNPVKVRTAGIGSNASRADTH